MTILYKSKKRPGSLVSQAVEARLFSELAILQELSQITSQPIRDSINYKGFLLTGKTTDLDFHMIIKSASASTPQALPPHPSVCVIAPPESDRIVPVKAVRWAEAGNSSKNKQALLLKTPGASESPGRCQQYVLKMATRVFGKSSTIKQSAIITLTRLRLLEVKKMKFTGSPCDRRVFQ